MQHLRCKLCSLSYMNPKMCPHCSEIFCSRCITAYLSEHHFCPSCDTYIIDLHDCSRLVEQVKEHLRGTSAIESTTYGLCENHQLPLRYYCEQCKQVICSDCGVIESNHKTHTIIPRPALPNRLSQRRLQLYVEELDRKIEARTTMRKQLVFEKELLKSQVHYCKEKLAEYYSRMADKLEREAEAIATEIDKGLKEQDGHLVKHQKTKQDLLQALQKWSADEQTMLATLCYDNQLLKWLAKQTTYSQDAALPLFTEISPQRIPQPMLATHTQLNILKELSPEYSNHTFELTYPNVADIVYSPPFSVFGQNFKLKIYPGGSANVRNHLSLFLEMEGPEDCEIRNFDYRLSLISLNNVDKTISKDYNSPFAAGSCWGYKHFVELDKIRDYVTNGKLIFALGIRAISYYEQCQLMANQIKALEKDRGLVDGSQGTQSLTENYHEQWERDGTVERESRTDSNIVDSDTQWVLQQ